jgi:hypothetical protein
VFFGRLDRSSPSWFSFSSPVFGSGNADGILDFRHLSVLVTALGQTGLTTTRRIWALAPASSRHHTLRSSVAWRAARPSHEADTRLSAASLDER